MKVAHDFVAARAAAQHCPELVARGPRPEEREAQISAWRRDLARHLASGLGALLSGDRISAEITPPEWLTGAEAIARIGPVAANCLLRCGVASSGPASAGAASSGAGSAALLSFDHANALALAERSFGGDGHVGEPSLDPLPRSALLIIDEIAALVARALGAALRGEDNPGEACKTSHAEVILRSENAARLRAFTAGDPCVLLGVTFANQEGGLWQAQIAMHKDALEGLLPQPGNQPLGQSPAASKGADKRASDASFGAIPLGVCAVLAEVELSLGQLGQLAPGDTIPLAMPRSVPLRVGDAVLGHGSIGTIEDRMALRLVNLPAPLLSEGFSQ